MKKVFSEVKILTKPFLIVFLISFLIINWNSISWIFNYKIASHFFSGFFQEVFSQGSNQGLPGDKIGKEKIVKEAEFSEKENILEIPKIGAISPLILVEKETEAQKALDRGVVLFPASALPGQTGQTIILGHSAPPGWPKIKYQRVFSQVNELEEGDEITLYFNHKKYQYLVQRKIFLEKGEELPQDLTGSGNMLILISCWPPGKDLRRIAVVARIIEL